MTTVLQYLVIAAVIGLVVFGIAMFVFGRGEQLAPLSPRVSPTELPDADMTADDVRKVRFAMALRGYRMSDVDWALERMAGELDRLRNRIADLSGSGADPDADDSEAEQYPGSPDELAGVAAGARNSGSAPTAADSAQPGGPALRGGAQPSGAHGGSAHSSSAHSSTAHPSTAHPSSGEQQ